MSKEKQMIEEMAKTLCGEKEKRCENCDSYRSCEFWIEASILHNTGYRKQSEGEWIKQVKVRKEGKPLLYYYQCSLCGVYLAEQANFCPNCGAKMKGGE